MSCVHQRHRLAWVVNTCVVLIAGQNILDAVRSCDPCCWYGGASQSGIVWIVVLRFSYHITAFSRLLSSLEITDKKLKCFQNEIVRIEKWFAHSRSYLISVVSSPTADCWLSKFPKLSALYICVQTCVVLGMVRGSHKPGNRVIMGTFVFTRNW